MQTIDHFSQAEACFAHAMEGIRVYHALCADFDFTHAEIVRNGLFLYLEVALDDLAHGYKLAQLSNDQLL